MNDTRIGQALALVDDARCLVADLEDGGGHNLRDKYQLASARECLNSAITYLNRLTEGV